MSEKYNYAEAVRNDVLEYIKENVDLQEYAGDRDGLIERLNDDGFVDITGNADGSYFCNAWKAEEALCHNAELLAEACEELGVENATEYLKNPEAGDVVIRCYVLAQAIDETVEQIEEALNIDLNDEQAFEGDTQKYNEQLNELSGNEVKLPETSEYNYIESVKDDVVEYIKESDGLLEQFAGDRDGLIEKLNDDCFIADSVTGNASGSYYCNAWKAEEAVCHNTELLAEACEEFGVENAAKYLSDPEGADVTIRCYVLPQVMEEAVEQVEQELGIDLDDEHTFEQEGIEQG